MFAWMVVCAGRIFSIVGGEPPPPRSSLISLSFIAVLVGGRSRPPQTLLTFAGFSGLAAAVALFEWARRSIRGRYFSYVFSNDIPASLFTGGPFAYIRNPFYASYLIAIAAVAVAAPSLVRWLILVGMIFYFHAAARFEESKFERSVVADEYAAYKRRTGRFLPKLST